MKKYFVLVILIGFLFPASQAAAFGFKLQANAGGGLANIHPDDDIEYDSAFGLGFGASALIDFGGSMVGVYGQSWTSNEHTADTAIRSDLDASHLVFGAMYRQEILLLFLQLNVGYVTGEVVLDTLNFLYEIETTGANVGGAIGVTIPLIPLLVSLDVGPYFQYMRIWPTDEDSRIEPGDYFQIGLMVQVGLGIGVP